MPSILAILILLGIIQGISANQPGTVLFKFVNNKSRIENVQIYQNGKEVEIYKAGEDGQAILLPTDKQAILLPTNLNKFKQFMVELFRYRALQTPSFKLRISLKRSGYANLWSIECLKLPTIWP